MFQITEESTYTAEFWKTIDTSSFEQLPDGTIHKATRAMLYWILERDAHKISQVKPLAVKLAIQIRDPRDVKQVLLQVGDIPIDTPLTTALDFRKEVVERIY